MNDKTNTSTTSPKKPTMFGMVFAYKKFIILLIIFTVLANLISLSAPKIIAFGIDSYTTGTFDSQRLFWQFVVVAVFVFVFTYIQNILQTYASETVGRDLREKLVAKIAEQEFSFVQKVTPAALLTNLTSDVDAVKLFVAQAIGTIISSICLIIGAAILLLVTDWQLALGVLLIVPIIAITFSMILGRVRKLFMKTQKIIDQLNNVINESILGSALIRVLNSQSQEKDKFSLANTNVRNIGFEILSYFSILIPVITLVAGMATLLIVGLGGHFVITGSMTLGSIAAFNSYVGILIFPIIMIGFMSGVISRSSASYERIESILSAQSPIQTDVKLIDITGNISVSHLTLKYGQKNVLDDLSFTIKAGTKTAIIGPTAAGKTQLLYTLHGLLKSTEGEIYYDDVPLQYLDPSQFHKQVGFVFQDSIIFNVTVRENIAFSESVRAEDLQKAIETAELGDFVVSLPQGLDTIISERGTSLSGGQKQRIMLARALALNPKVLLLDDFTARVDTKTEQTILDNVAHNYPHLTLISVTQKIASVVDYDQIILLMEGEIIAIGKHTDLLKQSPEYVQLYESQHSTSHYEIHT